MSGSKWTDSRGPVAQVELLQKHEPVQGCLKKAHDELAILIDILGTPGADIFSSSG